MILIMLLLFIEDINFHILLAKVVISQMEFISANVAFAIIQGFLTVHQLRVSRVRTWTNTLSIEKDGFIAALYTPNFVVYAEVV